MQLWNSSSLATVCSKKAITDVLPEIQTVKYM